jgi:hypothetical protein
MVTLDAGSFAQFAHNSIHRICGQSKTGFHAKRLSPFFVKLLEGFTSTP